MQRLSTILGQKPAEVFWRVPRAPAAILHLHQLHSSGSPGAKVRPQQVSVPGAFTQPDPDERLKHLRSGEKTVAVFAGVSMLLGYFALKHMSTNATSTISQLQESLQKELPVLVVAGPSGSGKSTLLNKLFKKYPDKFAFSVSHTTRKPRGKETNGVEYHFTSREEMQKSIDAGDFIEWAEYSGNLYGTSVKSVMDCQKQRKICVLDIDMQGVRSIKATDLKALYVHIKPPSLAVLEERLRARKTDSDEAVKKRLEVAKQELDYAAVPGMFDHIVVNDDVDKAYGEMDAIIMQMLAEKTNDENNT